MSGIGHNKPPSAIELTAECFIDTGDWLKANPVVQNEDDARACKAMVDRASATLKDLEAERSAKTTPLRLQVDEINSEYRSPRTTLEKLRDELLSRLAAFMDAEKAKREAAAAEAKRIADEAEREAREAEAKEHEAIKDAQVGVETDVASATVEADQKFQAFEKASRFAARAERETKVKVGGGFTKALGFKTQEVLVLEDAHKAIETMGVTDKIREAILSSARDYRKTFEELPDGVVATKERRL